MRHLILVLFIFHTTGLLSQENADNVLHLTNIPAEGVVFEKGWKFHPGDNPDFARTDYDDGKWVTIDPILGIDKQPDFVKSGICWLRLKFSVSADLQKQQVAFIINQTTASEIYLDGSLVYKFGTISANTGETVAYNPSLLLPLSLPVNFGSVQVLAVRYKIQPDLNLSIIPEFSVPLLQITMLTENEAFKQVKIKERHMPVTNTFRIGAYFILAILYLAFFLYNPSYKAYLLFFLFTIFGMPSDILQFNYPGELQKSLLLMRVFTALWEIAQLFLLSAVYLLLNQKRGWIYWVLFCASVLGMFINSWFFSELIVVNLINLELVRICFKTLKLKIRGSWILTSGALCFLFLMGAFYIGIYFKLNYWSIPISESLIIADILYGVAQLSIPIATTIYVAVDFGFTNHALKQKLEEVKELSQKTITQEKEKQQILSSQDVLEEQVNQRTSELKLSLRNLQSAQAQLVQAEKMASLGELTAGIAHEIQNPLNFVNNFSDVNAELADELKAELAAGNLQSVSEIADSIKENEQKINHHGKRADAIVKGMLQHSRKGEGQKEPTDINALCDEYLRLSYHGLRAKDKNFNAIPISIGMKTDFDESIGKVSIIPQDIGRVLLNLYNNAFYAAHTPDPHRGEKYEPVVTVKTKKVGDKIFISVGDNGPGIPQNIIDKIFQPFFTTKPTGQGTGLGLSLAYDIVKAHGGEIKVETKEASPDDKVGQGTEFIIQLPIV